MKVSKCRKFGDLIFKTVALVKFLKTKNLTEKVSEFCNGRAWVIFVLKISLMSQFSILNPQTFGTN